MNKVSKCNITYDNQDQLTVYNSRIGTIDRFSGKARQSVIDAFEGRNDDLLCVRYLLKQGYLLPSSIDEDKLISDTVDKLIKNDDMLFLTIYPTEACNFRCKYCPESTTPVYMENQTAEKLLLFLESVLPKYKRLIIAWFGGEPLLASNIIDKLSSEIKKLCRKNNVIFSASMTTNGYYLDAKMLQKMLQNNVFSYCVSVDGTAEIHDKQRQLKNGASTWKRIVDNLVEIRDKVDSKLFTIIIRTNVTSRIYKDSNPFFQFLSKEFNSDRRFLFMWKKAEDWGNIDECDKELICSYSDFLEFLYAARDSGVKNNLLSRTMAPLDRICESSIQNALVIFPDGRISKCSRDVCPELTTLGYIDDLMHNPEPYLHNKLLPQYDAGCHGCSNYFHCLGLGCPLEADQCNLSVDYTEKLLSSISDADIPGGVISLFGG